MKLKIRDKAVIAVICFVVGVYLMAFAMSRVVGYGDHYPEYVIRPWLYNANTFVLFVMAISIGMGVPAALFLE